MSSSGRTHIALPRAEAGDHQTVFRLQKYLLSIKSILEGGAHVLALSALLKKHFVDLGAHANQPLGISRLDRLLTHAQATKTRLWTTTL